MSAKKRTTRRKRHTTCAQRIAAAKKHMESQRKTVRALSKKANAALNKLLDAEEKFEHVTASCEGRRPQVRYGEYGKK
jgi:hypothetical protein